METDKKDRQGQKLYAPNLSIQVRLCFDLKYEYTQEDSSFTSISKVE